MKTDRNVDVLDRAGVLGAVLALIAREATSVRKKRPLSKASADCLQVNTPPAHAREAISWCCSWRARIVLATIETGMMEIALF